MNFISNLINAVKDAPRVVWWLCGNGLIYLVFVVVNSIWPLTSVMFIQIAWIIMMSLPLWNRSVARLLNIKTLWEK